MNEIPSHMNELGHNVAEQLHLQSTGRGFADIDIHEYDWSLRC